MKKYFFVLTLLISQGSFAADIYKCTDKNGNQTYSDSKCPESTSAEKVKYKDATLDDQLKALAPGNSKITNITRKDGDTFIDYEFTTQEELKEFMRLSQKLSGKHVNLLKFEAPKGNDAGKASVQITAKESFLGKKEESKN